MKSILQSKKKLANLLFAGLVGGVVSLLGFYVLAPKAFEGRNIEEMQSSSAQLARYASLNPIPVFDFTSVAEIANPAVVHIKTTVGSSRSQQQGQMPFDPFEFLMVLGLSSITLAQVWLRVQGSLSPMMVILLPTIM